MSEPTIMKLKQIKERGMNFMTYKVGDLVRVKLGLEVGREYGGTSLSRITLSRIMSKNNGKVMKVIEPGKDCFFLNDNYWYHNEMLEPIDNFSVGDVVRVREDIGSLKDERPGITRSMKEIAGNIGHIDSIRPVSGNTYIGLAGSVTSWLPQWLDKVEECKESKEDKTLKEKCRPDSNNQTYELKQDRNTTVILKKNNGKVVNRGVAKCMETDKFNETFGLIMASIKLAKDIGDKLTEKQADELQQAIENLSPQKSLEKLNEELTKKSIEYFCGVFR